MPNQQFENVFIPVRNWHREKGVHCVKALKNGIKVATVTVVVCSVEEGEGEAEVRVGGRDR